MRRKRKSGARIGTQEHQSLGSEQAELRPAEGHEVDAGVGGECAQRQTERCGRIAQARAVQMDQQTKLVRMVGESPQLRD